jgi:hypothetical protein
MKLPELREYVRAQLVSAVTQELSSLPLIRPLKQAEIAGIARQAVSAVLKRTTLVKNERQRQKPYASKREVAETLTSQAASMGRQCLTRGLMSVEEIEGTINGKSAVQHTLFMVVLNPIDADPEQ